METSCNELKITEHAYDRAKERLGWKHATLDKMALKAMGVGLTHKDIKGKLSRYVDGLWIKYKSCNNIRIHGEVVYIFSNQTLITLYRIDLKLIKHLKYNQ